jgi:O-antigen/teichoic acid export membrane protein
LELKVVFRRSLARVDYGIFALLFGILLVSLSIHSTFVAIPLSVFGADSTDRERKHLNGYALVFGAVIAVPMALVCVGACIFLRRAALSPLVVIAMFSWLLQETARRALMAELRFRDALWGDAISYLGQVLALIILAREGALSISAAFAVMAATSVISAILQVVQAGVLVPAWPDVLPVAKRFCYLGIWPTLGSLASALTIQVFPWTLAAARGPAQTAMYQAVVNLVSVSHPLLFSVGSLIVPASARAMAKNGIHAAKRIALRYGAQGALLVVPYFLVLFLLFPKPALRLLYGASSPYVKLDQGVRIFVIAYAFVYLSQVLASLFNGIARGKLVFMASLAGAAIALGAAIPLIALLGMTGAIIAFCFVYGARSLLFVYSYRNAA